MRSLLFSLLLFLRVSVVCIRNAAASYQTPRLETIHAWKYVDYEWENACHRAAAVAAGDYNYTKPVIIDADRSRDGRTFVTVVRDVGVPSSLNVVGRRRGPGGPLLRPYPDWKWARRGDCNAITSVHRVAIDHCDRLWVLDNGEIARETVCPAQLLVFDLNTDELIRRIRIPNNLAHGSASKAHRLITPIIDTHGPNCTNTTVYMTDPVGHGLVIYDEDSGKIWRLESEVFAADPSAVNCTTVADESFRLGNGVLMGMTKNRHAPVLYFRPTSSRDIHSATTIDLRESRLGLEALYRTIRDAVPCQTASMAISSNDVLFLGLPAETSLACWNTCKPFTKDNLSIVVRDRDRLQFVSGMKIVPGDLAGANEEIWMVTDRTRGVTAASNFSDVNFRVVRANVARLTAGTACASS